MRGVEEIKLLDGGISAKMGWDRIGEETIDVRVPYRHRTSYSILCRMHIRVSVTCYK